MEKKFQIVDLKPQNKESQSSNHQRPKMIVFVCLRVGVGGSYTIEKHLLHSAPPWGQGEGELFLLTEFERWQVF